MSDKYSGLVGEEALRSAGNSADLAKAKQRAFWGRVRDWMVGIIAGFTVTVGVVPCKECKTGVKPEVKVEAKAPGAS